MTKRETRGTGRDANPLDGDSVVFFAVIRDGRVWAGPTEIVTEMVRVIGDVTTRVTFRSGAEARRLGRETFRGCEVARKAAVALNDLVAGRTVDEVFDIQVGQLIEELGDVPIENERCVLTVIGAMRSAVIDAQVAALVDATYEARTMRPK